MMTSEDKMSMSLDDIIKKGAAKGSSARALRGGRGARGMRGRGRFGSFQVRGSRGGGGRGNGQTLGARGRGRIQQPTGRGRGNRVGRFQNLGRGRGAGGASNTGLQQQLWTRSRSRSRGPGSAQQQQQQQRARSLSRGPAGDGRGRGRSCSRSRPAGPAGRGVNRSLSRSRGAFRDANLRSRSRSRGLGGGAQVRNRSVGGGGRVPRSLSRGRSRSRSRSRPPAGILQGRARSRSRSAIRNARSLTPVARGHGQRAAPRLVLFRAAPGSVPWPQSHRLMRSRVRRAARFLNLRGRQAAAPHGAGAVTSEWKMAGTFRSDYVLRQPHYQTSMINSIGDISNDILFGSGNVGGNQLLVNIQNEYAMHPAPGARRTWQRSRGLRRNQNLGAVGRHSQINMAAGGETAASTLGAVETLRQTVALQGSPRNTAQNGLPRKMTESSAQLVPTLVVEQNIVENMGQPSANTTRMTLSERFSKQHSSTVDSGAVYTQSD